jgi:hypothetical protein
MMQVAEQGDNYSADYIYIYDTVNDEWVNVSSMSGTRDTQEKLMIELLILNKKSLHKIIFRETKVSLSFFEEMLQWVWLPQELFVSL